MTKLNLMKVFCYSCSNTSHFTVCCSTWTYTNTYWTQDSIYMCMHTYMARLSEDLNSFPLWRTGGDHQDALVLRGWRLSIQQNL